MQPSIRKLHVDVATKFGKLFDVEPCDMDLNVGKRGRFINVPVSYGYERHFEIVAVQKLYDGRIAYRVVEDTDTYNFGLPAKAEDIQIFEEGEEQPYTVPLATLFDIRTGKTRKVRNTVRPEASKYAIPE